LCKYFLSTLIFLIFFHAHCLTPCIRAPLLAVGKSASSIAATTATMSSAGAAGGGGDASGGLGALMANLAHANGSGVGFFFAFLHFASAFAGSLWTDRLNASPKIIRHPDAKIAIHYNDNSFPHRDISETCFSSCRN
jgi:hypothetical protein